jgi:hypothetical protein
MSSAYLAFSERGRDAEGWAGRLERCEDGLPAGFGRQPLQEAHRRQASLAEDARSVRTAEAASRLRNYATTRRRPAGASRGHEG